MPDEPIAKGVSEPQAHATTGADGEYNVANSFEGNNVGRAANVAHGGHRAMEADTDGTALADNTIYTPHWKGTGVS